MALLFSVIIGYLLGSIPFGYVLTKTAGLGDIRTVGSGNIGATNVLRTGNKQLAALTLFCDGLKGAIAVLIVGALFPGFEALAGLMALIGHIFPVWLKFKGGKGVATAVGVVTALAWPVGLISMLVWIAVAFIYRYSSLAALVALGLTPVEGLLLGYNNLIWLLFAMMLLIFWKHSANIRRLLNGTEPKIGAKKDATPPAQ
jgi:glycerol-3-phosphate acyltransferase PlsY